MSELDSRRTRGHHFRPVDDGQIGPDTDTWPSEQMRRIEDRYRSWRQDRYRETTDESARERREPRQPHPRGDVAPPKRHRHDPDS